jgi:hypothetical protein
VRGVIVRVVLHWTCGASWWCRRRGEGVQEGMAVHMRGARIEGPGAAWGRSREWNRLGK